MLPLTGIKSGAGVDGGVRDPLGPQGEPVGRGLQEAREAGLVIARRGVQPRPDAARAELMASQLHARASYWDLPRRGVAEMGRPAGAMG